MEHRVFGTPCPGVQYHTRAGAYLIAVAKGEIAMIQTPKGCFLPGGGLDPGETHADCIRRECLEEMGFRIRVDQRLCSAESYLVHEAVGYFHPVQYYYTGILLESVCEPVESDHHLVWLPCAQAAGRMCVEQQAWAVRQALKETLR